MRPVIAITHSFNQSKVTVFALKLAIWLAGGKPLCITPEKNNHFESYDGLLIGGGVDVNPERYGKEKKPGYVYQNERDRLEFEHLKTALNHNRPVLGICRGAQLMNVFHQGTLHLDIQKAYEKSKYPSNIIGYIFFRKWIYLIKPSRLFDMFRAERVRVNSLHKQSIDQVGAGFRVTAQEQNGIIQCIEHVSKPFLMGVQFHPEFLLYRTRSRRLFRALVLNAKNNIQRSSEQQQAV